MSNLPVKKSKRDDATSEDKRRLKQKPNNELPSLPTGITFQPIEQRLPILRVDTSKDKIAQPPLAADPRKIIPPLGSAVIICGKSGSGKSTLLENLLTDPRFYGKSAEKPGGWFDKMFLFSPTAGTDDVLRSLGIPAKHVFTDISEAQTLLEVIQKSQKGKLEGGGKAHTVEQFAVIFEDIIGETTFMNTAEFKMMFYMVRHMNCTTFVSTQHFTRVPKVCRLQASFIFFFAGSRAEVEIVCDEFAPPMYTKREFEAFVNEATRGDHSFLTICMKVGWKHRYRRNLDEFVCFPRLVEECDEEAADAQATPAPTGRANSTDFYDENRKLGEAVIKQNQLYRGRRDVDEQAAKILGEWAHKGARGRTFF